MGAEGKARKSCRDDRSCSRVISGNVSCSTMAALATSYTGAIQMSCAWTTQYLSRADLKTMAVSGGFSSCNACTCCSCSTTISSKDFFDVIDVLGLCRLLWCHGHSISSKGFFDVIDVLGLCRLLWCHGHSIALVYMCRQHAIVLLFLCNLLLHKTVKCVGV